MNVYDFDGTIYGGDSPTNFFMFLLKKKKHIKVLRYFPSFLIDGWKYATKSIDKTKLKETFYRFLNVYKNGEIDGLVNEFWDTQYDNIFKFYFDRQKDDDVVISASPRWLLSKFVNEKLHIKNLICSEMDKTNGEYLRPNCYGAEKVNRFKELYGDMDIEEFYSDSYSDEPLALISKKAFLVDKIGQIIPWDFNHK